MKDYLVNRKLWLLWGMVSLSFLLRFLTAYAEVAYPDSCLYLSYAKAILNGKLSFDFKQGTEMILPPLYSLFSAAVSFINVDLELAGVLVSVLAGALLIIPVFYLAKDIYNETAAWIASALVMFSPHLLHWSGAILTESLFITLFISGITLGWYAFQGNKKLFIFLSGVVIGLSYMTRIIGLVAVPVVVLWTIYYFLLSGKSGNYPLRENSKRVISFLILFVVGFFIVTGPYLVHIRSVFGHWDITASYGTVGSAIGSIGYSSIAEREMRTPKSPSTEGVHTMLFKKLSGNIRDYSSGILTIFSFMVIFALTGLFTRWKILYLITAIAVYVASLLVQPLNPYLDERVRYLSPVVPLFLVMVSGGILNIHSWIKSGTAKKLIVPVMIGVVLISFILQYNMFPVHFHRFQGMDKSKNLRRQAGEWMKKNLTHPRRVMSRTPYIPYYADAVWFSTPATYKTAMNLAKTKNIDYMVIDRSIDFYLQPELRFLFNTTNIPPELNLILGIGNTRTKKLHIGVYKIEKDLMDTQAHVE